MAIRSPWILAALALAWLGGVSIFVSNPLGIIVLWATGIGLVGYTVRPSRSHTAIPGQPGHDPQAPPQRADPPVVAIRVLTAEEAAALLRVETAAVIAAMESGRLPGNNITGQWRCAESSLTAWLNGSWQQ